MKHPPDWPNLDNELTRICELRGTEMLLPLLPKALGNETCQWQRAGWCMGLALPPETSREALCGCSWQTVPIVAPAVQCDQAEKGVSPHIFIA